MIALIIRILYAPIILSWSSTEYEKQADGDAAQAGGDLVRHGRPSYPDDLYAGELHAVAACRNGTGGVGKNGTPHAGGETPAGCGNDIRAGAGGNAE